MSTHMAENYSQNKCMTMFQTQIVLQGKINNWYSFSTIPVDKKMDSVRFQMIIYRF